jgi:ribosomal protein S12 methylthiotransferase accessory factor
MLPTPAAAPPPAPPGLRKGFSSGTHRLVPPEETLRRMTPLMPLLGITRIADVTGLDHVGVPVVMVTRPNARSLSVAQGKGLTLAAAKASGLMEAIESHHAEHITLPLRLASYNDLCFAHRMIDVPALPRYARGSFHPSHRTLWIEGTDLFDGRPRMLPHALVHTDFTLPLPPGTGTFFMTSSGLSSGNHVIEAVCHGVAELIERDAVTLWRARGDAWRRATRLDLDSVDDPACRAILARYAAADVAVEAWDITSDVGVAAFHAVIVDRDPDPGRAIGPMGGMGCHPSRGVALLRALTEAAQSRLTMISGARDDLLVERLDQDAYLTAHARFHERRGAPGPRRSFSAVPTREHATFEEDLGFMLAGLRAVGCTQAVVVNLTKPELGVPVVRVVIPGLEVLDDLPGYLPGKRARAARAEAPS